MIMKEENILNSENFKLFFFYQGNSAERVWYFISCWLLYIRNFEKTYRITYFKIEKYFDIN